jgi:hypothetical protein
MSTTLDLVHWNKQACDKVVDSVRFSFLLFQSSIHLAYDFALYDYYPLLSYKTFWLVYKLFSREGMHKILRNIILVKVWQK